MSKEKEHKTEQADSSAVETIVNRPSNMYRAMIYAAVATIYFYSKDIEINKDMTVEDFRVKNANLVERVFIEIKKTFKYELSHEQMGRAIYGYMSAYLNPQSVKHTPVFEMGG